MTAVRFIPLPIHSALRMVTGLMTMVLPFAVGMQVAPAVVLAVVGAVVTGVALSATPDERGRVRIAVRDLRSFDAGAVIGLYGAGLVFGLAGDLTALVTFAAVASVWLAGNTATRYALAY